MSKTKTISKKRSTTVTGSKNRKWLKRLSLSFALAALPTNVPWQFDIDNIPNAMTVIDEYRHKNHDALSDKKALIQEVQPSSILIPTPKDNRLTQNGNWAHVFRGNVTDVTPLNTTPIPTKAIKWLTTRIKFLTIEYEMLKGDTHYKPVVDEWRKHLDLLKPLSKKEQLDTVNLYYNDIIKYTADSKVYKAKEYFAAPQETLYNKAGDCEDYAILKYYSLKYLGFEDKDLRIAAVDLMKNSTDLETAQKQSAHAVLLVDTPDGIYMLDNNGQSLPEPISNNKKYQIMYSFNETTLSKYSLYRLEDRISDRKNVLAQKQANNKLSIFGLTF